MNVHTDENRISDAIELTLKFACSLIIAATPAFALWSLEAVSVVTLI
jgi:hypothetical protein